MFGKKILLAVISGISLGIGFVIPQIWWIVFFGMGTFLYLLSKSSSFKQTTLYAYGVGLVWHGVALAPIFFSVFPFDWFGVPSITLQVLVVMFSWLVATFVFSLGAGVFGAFYWVFREHVKTLHALYVLPLAWVLSEWIGMWMFSITLAGPGSLIGAHMSAGSIGYLLANNLLLLQIASIGGLLLLSVAIVVAGYGLLQIYINYGRINKTYLIASTIFVFVILFFGHHWVGKISYEGAQEKQINVATVSRYLKPHLSFEPGEEEEIAMELYNQIAPLSGVDVIVFPENSAFVRSLEWGDLGIEKSDLLKIGDGTSAPVMIDSEDIEGDEGGFYSRGVFWTENQQTFTYKQLIMPLGEYVPYFYSIFMRALWQGELLEKVSEVRAYYAGPEENIGIVNGVSFALRFCDEVFSGELFRNSTKNGANVLVNISSQSWFHGSPIVYKQMQMAAQVRAVENRRFLLQSGNMTPAFVINEWGGVVAETKWGVPSVVQMDVPLISTKTPYSIFGELLVYGAMLVLLGTYVWDRRRVFV